jgi:hypothetical protein
MRKCNFASSVYAVLWVQVKIPETGNFFQQTTKSEKMKKKIKLIF